MYFIVIFQPAEIRISFSVIESICFSLADCILTAQQLYGPGTVLCDILQVLFLSVSSLGKLFGFECGGWVFVVMGFLLKHPACITAQKMAISTMCKVFNEEIRWENWLPICASCAVRAGKGSLEVGKAF